MKILVTGGAGFIGSHLVKKLCEKGDEVVIVDDFNDFYDPKLKQDRIEVFLKDCEFKLYKEDIRDIKAMEQIFKKENPEKIVHLAAMAGVQYSIKNPLLYEDVNIKGTMNLLELAVKYKVKNFVLASTSSIYGKNEKYPYSETDKADQPITPYASTKGACELIAHTYSHLHDLNVTVLRFFTVYGPWGRPDMAYFIFADKISKGEPIDVNNRGEMWRDFTYVDDIISGILLVLDKDYRYEIFNIGGDKSEKLTDFIAQLEKHFGKEAEKRMADLPPGDVLKTVADVEKLRKLGWQPTTKIEEGLKKFVDWYKKYYKIKD